MNNLKVFLFTIVLLELFIGGSGQVFKIFGIPFRQILFSFLLLVYVFDLIIGTIKLKIDLVSIHVLFLILWVFTSAYIGIIKDNDTDIIFKDVSPMLYFVVYFPLLAYIDRLEIGYSFIYKVMVFSSFVVSVVVLATYYLLHFSFGSDVYTFRAVVEEVLGKEIFWFRVDGYVFYPGLTYVLIASILLVGKFFDRKMLSFFEISTLSISILAIVISMTKGLILALVIGFLFLMFTKDTKLKIKIYTSIFLFITSMILVSQFDFSRFTAISKDSGTLTRYQTMEESFEKINESPILGNGFGTELPSRKIHQENSFLDIWMEQGLIGLYFYLFMFIHFLLHRDVKPEVFISALSLMLMSFTNPYVNNPLGIGFLIISLILLRKKKITNE